MTNHPVDKRCECDNCIRAQMINKESTPTLIVGKGKPTRLSLNMRKVTLPACPAVLRPLN